MPLYRTRAPVIDLDDGLSAIGKAFAPPTSQEVAVMQRGQEAARKAASVEAIRNGSRNLGDFFGSDVADPVRSYAIADMYGRSQAPGAKPQDLDASSFALHGNAGNTFAGLDVNNRASMARTQVEQQGALGRAMAAPVGKGETRFVSPTVASVFGVAPMQTGVVELNQGQQATLPDGRVLSGAEKPLSTDELAAQDAQQRPLDDPLRVALGFKGAQTTNVQTLEGPRIVTVPQSLGQAPAPTAAPPSELAKLQAERDTLPTADPRRAEYDNRIASLGRGPTPDPYRDVSDRALATRHGELVKAGEAAGSMAGNLDRLEALLTDVPTGALAERKLQVAQYAQDIGLTDVASALTGGKLDEATAANAIVQRLAPALRVPGSGAQSDRELQNFLASLPSLRNTPGGNRIILDTLRGAAQRQQQAAAIARQSQSGTLDKFEAERHIAALASPFAQFSGGSPGEGTVPAPAAAPASAAPAAPEAWVRGPDGKLKRAQDGTVRRKFNPETGRIE